jgi:hypothetical protein
LDQSKTQSHPFSPPLPKKACKQISKEEEEEEVVVGNYKYAVIYMGIGEGRRGRVFKLKKKKKVFV